MNDVLTRIILGNQEVIKSKKLVERNIHIPDVENIIALTGIRRCGKTHILYNIAKKVNKENILFLDFEDERLINLKNLDNYDIIIDSYNRVFPDKKPILFFDEIQGLKNWHLYIKRLYTAGYKIYITGSNVNLLSREIATYLTGRSIEIQIFPFSFSEFLNLKKFNYTEKDFYINENKFLNLFDEYLIYGGFPEVIKAEKTDKKVVSKNIYRLLFYRDLITKYDKDEYILKLIISKLMENITKEFSLTSLANKVSSIHKVSKPTVNEYFNILPNPFLTENIYQHRQSFIKRETYRKTYFADNSFITLNSVDNNYSKLFENLVFNHLQRISDTINYYKTNNNLEVDFFVEEDFTKKIIQVSYSLSNEDTKKRKLKALIKTMNETNINEGYIITSNEEEKIIKDDKKIYIKPAWKWFLNK